MTPNNRKPFNQGPGPGARKDNTGNGAASRIKMLLAAGAVAGTFGGWALLSQQDMVSAGQANVQPAATAFAAELSTATPTAQATATGALSTATSTTQAAATTAESTATPTAQATATATAAEPTSAATPQATAATVQQAATVTPTAVTRTRSSR